MQNKLVVTIYLLFFSGFSFSQNQITIKGTLIDEEKNAPIPFANIYLNHKGTTSNQSGNFHLSFTQEKADTIIMISCIGYEKRKISVKQLSDLYNRIFLKPKTEVLKEVVVTSLSPVQILKKVEKKLSRNVNRKIFSGKLTIEQYLFDGADTLLGHSILSGLLNDRQVGYDSLKIYPKIQVEGLAVSTNFFFYDTIPNPIFPTTNSLSPYFLYFTEPVRNYFSKELIPFPRIFGEGFYSKTEIAIEGIQEFDGEKYYLISVVASSKQRDVAGYFLINTKDFGLKSVMIKGDNYDLSGNLFSKTHLSASYIKIDKKYFLSSFDLLLKRDTGNGAPIYYFNSVQLTDIKTKSIDKVPYKTMLKKNSTYKDLVNKAIINSSMDNQNNWSLLKTGSFIKPVRECAGCSTNDNSSQ